ncbi:MAG TPA: sugar isomerase [Phycisphaerae bacterium]|nr:sugar isomerase [Phycisphaerae bacterium]HRY68152.1 sugar isomerase [Phycisphaerae bacterium]HSA27048.1 sugar isomerase [Phycisphaerae bacterium]
MGCTCLNRRELLGATAGTALSIALVSRAAAPASEGGDWRAQAWDPDRPFRIGGRPLRVQPVLMYQVPRKREAASWKSWGGVQTEEAAGQEIERITRELKALADQAVGRLEFLPAVKVRSVEEAAAVHRAERDADIVYPATGSGDTLQACVTRDHPVILFVRHRSGPIYYWYEALSSRYLATDEPGAAGPAAPALGNLSVDDVVVDDITDLAWRLRGLYGARNLLGTRIVALGGPWGKYAPAAPDVARQKHRIEIVETTYQDLEPRIQKTMADTGRMSLAARWADRFLSLPGTKLQTDKSFVVNAFMLYGLFKELMRENGAEVFTIKDCMRTIMPMSRTTACLTLGLLNDEGLLAFCESDFVIIPAGILLRHIAGTPVFLHNSTFPHKGIVTCAHCAAPRRMNAQRYEPTAIMTHYESDYGASSKVDIPEGTEVTFIDPEYATGRWLGFKGKVRGNPQYEICRSQQDVEILGNWRRLLTEVRDSHWVMVYGDHLDAAGYAARKLGIRWESLSGA